MSDTLLLDRYGRGISSNQLYKTPSHYVSPSRLSGKPRAKTYEAITSYQRREMVDISRVMAAGVTDLDAALVQANEFAIGDSWHIKSRGGDRAWGKKRDEWFNKAYTRRCNVRGDQYDWRSTLRVLNWTRKVEGDYAIVFDGQARGAQGRETEPTGKFQVIRFDRINNAMTNWNGKTAAVSVGNGVTKVKELPSKAGSNRTLYDDWCGSWSGLYRIDDKSSLFDGQYLCDGVIVDANQNVLGYRVSGYNDAGNMAYVDVPASQIHFNFSARRQADLIRGIPELAEAIIPIMGLDDIQHLVTMAVKLASAMAIVRESTDGNPLRSNRTRRDEIYSFSTSGTVKRGYEEIFPGLYELSVSNKEKLSALAFNRPSMNEEAFIARVGTSVLHKFWPRSLIHSDDTRRAGTRAIAVQANTICWWDQSCVERSARWIADRATEFAMRAGWIPSNNNLDAPYDYVFTVPAKFSVDEGNDLKGYLLSLDRCCITHGIIAEMGGYLKEEIREEREEEIDWILTAAERISQKHPDFSAKEVALMFDSNNNNVSFSESVAPPAEEPPAGEPKPKQTP